MLNIQHRKIFLIGITATQLFAEIDIQKNIYNAAEEMIRYDEKMNQAIIKHNQLEQKDVDEMRLDTMMINDFIETPTGYLLQRNIEEHLQSEVKVEIQDAILIISTKTFNKDFFNTELNNTEVTTVSSMSVSLLIPNDADVSKMEESYKNGILSITFPFIK